MTVVVQTRDRCRICFSFLQRDRSNLFSSTCCQKYYHIFKHVKRTKMSNNNTKIYPNISSTATTVCFRDLIVRYLRTQLSQTTKHSNMICNDCSMTLLHIEQCAQYLRKTINELKAKLKKSNRLVTSSLSATFQKRRQLTTTVQNHVSMKNEPVQMAESDSSDEFNYIDDEEEFDEEQEDVKPPVLPTTTQVRPKSLHFTSPSSSGGESSSSMVIPNLRPVNVNNNNNKNNNTTINCACNDDDNDDDDDEDDDEEEDGLTTTSLPPTQHLSELLFRLQTNPITPNTSGLLNTSDSNGLLTTSNTMNLLDDPTTNPNIVQLRIAQMLAAVAASTGQNNNPNSEGNNNETFLNTFASVHRNLLFKLLTDPIAAAQAAHAAAAAAAVTATQLKANVPPVSLATVNNIKQSGSSRKRKSTPGKIVIANQRHSTNNGNTSPTGETESINIVPSISIDTSSKTAIKGESTDHPLELTVKNLQRSTQMNSNMENGNLSSVMQSYHPNYMISPHNHHRPSTDEEYKESATPNDSSLSLSPSLMHRITPSNSKRQRLSQGLHLDFGSSHNSPSMVALPKLSTATTDLLSPNHHQSNIDDNNNGQQRQQRKLDPRSCAECGKVLFSDKTHLLHCQTHAKNEKQCWICGVHDEDVKKHIVTVHGSQKFTNTGFKCQHCDKVFPVFADLDTHLREHSKKKPFECHICNKRFGQQGNLSCHLRIHSGVKPFSCTSCGKAFRHSNSLRRHARTVHSASRGISMSPASGPHTASSSLLASTSSTASLTIDAHRLSTSEHERTSFDDVSTALMIPSDEAESLQGTASPSTAGAPSPAMLDDSHEPLTTAD